jgi:hypothetical protein
MRPSPARTVSPAISMSSIATRRWPFWMMLRYRNSPAARPPSCAGVRCRSGRGHHHRHDDLGTVVSSPPGESVGISRTLIPLCFGAAGSVRTKVSRTSASWAPEVHTFCPSTTYSSPSRTARVRNPARSEPAPGSLIPSAAVISARRIGTAQRRFCSGVPNDSNEAATIPTPCGLALGTDPCEAPSTAR